MSKPVIHAQLHEGFFIQGLTGGGNVKNTLPPDNKTLKNFKMTLQENGTLLLEWEDGIYTKSYTVAAANIRGMQHPPLKTTLLDTPTKEKK